MKGYKLVRLLNGQTLLE